MENEKKGLIALSAFTILYVAFSIPAMIDYFKSKSYIEINGKKFTESDLEKEKPAVIMKLKKDYVEGISRAFEQFASDKILELEAKEQNIKPNEVVSKGVGSYTPSQTEIAAIYEQYKDQFGGAKLEQVQDRIVGYLKNLKEQEYYAELTKKYRIDYHMEKVKQVKQNVAEKGNPSIGPDKAKVTVIEFSDFECPYCKRSQETTRQLREQYKDKIRWVFRDYPLPFHRNAMFAHIAANCAIEQNKYWEYFNLLFDNSDNLVKENVILLAEKAGLDKTKFNACLADSGKISEEIQSDIADGQSVGVNGTPAFFINGIFVEGAQPIGAFQKIIDEELSK
ncbi:MAG TPA: thioredoxin domain-containing protein [Leptospiraceae bacterium]|nr:thioredoxin domain-containing protein [Leptospiraceae bacterium]HMW06580.1 thioredoxin domain-containing protein [Leptospiraceae bacterium]HMX32148.1 thioredoxin domain-containing protein [Leptospiraceae bacterium]HMY31229.1 thioredoxin domain-containing protein [Leptospiraceae bacterium]HMZ63284.1 thioredoxin domain-containing protein [Leptospiraceae bacterium]